MYNLVYLSSSQYHDWVFSVLLEMWQKLRMQILLNGLVRFCVDYYICLSTLTIESWWTQWIVMTGHHCYLWWRWWSDTLWLTLIRWCLYSLSCFIQVIVEISLQFHQFIILSTSSIQPLEFLLFEKLRTTWVLLLLLTSYSVWTCESLHVNNRNPSTFAQINLLWKFHKNPIKPRFICAPSSTSLADVSKCSTKLFFLRSTTFGWQKLRKANVPYFSSQILNDSTGVVDVIK
jgi:hypothetical protein